jgi:hypothetical protein
MIPSQSQSHVNLERSYDQEHDHHRRNPDIGWWRGDSAAGFARRLVTLSPAGKIKPTRIRNLATRAKCVVLIARFGGSTYANGG